MYYKTEHCSVYLFMNNLNAKSEIIDFTINLIKKYQGNLEKVTIREIASLGNWSVGLINYHFKNKENLIKICVNKIIEGVVFNYSPDMSNDDNKTDKENASFKVLNIKENSSNLVIFFANWPQQKNCLSSCFRRKSKNLWNQN